MSDCLSIERCISAATTQRRERLVTRIQQNGCRLVRVQNSMQELLAIVYLGKLGREARADLIGSLGRTEASPQAEQATAATGKSAGEKVDSLGRAERSLFSPLSAAPGNSLFEKSLQTTGRLVSEQT